MAWNKSMGDTTFTTICEILFLHLPEETQEAFFMSQKKSVKNITNKKGN